MVDCGGDRDEATADTVAAFLLSQGVFRLDGVILTHYDRDHVGAAEYVLSRIQTDQLILPQGEDANMWEDRFAGTALMAQDDLQMTWGCSSITVYTSNNLEDSNESSLCVLFQTEKCAILITGDRSAMGELQLLLDKDIPELDALVVGHHGAAASTGEMLLQKTKPKVALISVGEDNRYGHPSQAVIDRLVTYGCQIRRTDLEGTIILRG